MQFDDACITHQCINTDVCVTPTCQGGSSVGDYPGSGVSSVTENCASPPDCYAENGMELRVLNQADVDSLATCCLLWECIQRDDVCLEPVANETPTEESVLNLIIPNLSSSLYGGGVAFYSGFARIAKRASAN